MGKMVLNELESLEARHDSGNGENNIKVMKISFTELLTINDLNWIECDRYNYR